MDGFTLSKAQYKSLIYRKEEIRFDMDDKVSIRLLILNDTDMSNWEELKKLAKSFEFELDSKLSLLNNLITLISPHPYVITPYAPFSTLDNATNVSTGYPDEKLKRAELLLDEVSTKTEKLGQFVTSMRSIHDYPNTSLAKQLLQRHQDLLQDYKTDLNKIKVIFPCTPS